MLKLLSLLRNENAENRRKGLFLYGDPYKSSEFEIGWTERASSKIVRD